MLDWTAPVAVLLIVAVVGMSVVWAIRDARRRRSTRDSQAVNLGFTPLTAPYDSLRERLVRVHDCKSEKVTIRAAQRRDVNGFTLYIVDYTCSTARDIETYENAVAVLLPGLDLPLFRVYPRVQGSGLMSDLANRLLEGAMRATVGAPVSVPKHPRFTERYTLVLAEATQSDALPCGFYDTVSESEGVCVEGRGDLMLVSFLHSVSQRRLKQEDSLARTIQMAGRLAAALIAAGKD